MAQMTVQDNQVSQAAWAGDFLNREHLVPGGAKVLASAFNATDAVVVTADGNAIATATSITVDALSGAIPSGTMLYFGAGKYARTTAAAAAAATSISVEALPVQIDDNDVATYEGVGKKVVQAGTLLGRTFAERAAGTAFGPWATSDDECFIVAFDVTDADSNNDVELYRPGSVVKENLLPDFASLSANALAALRAAYVTTRGVS